MKELKKSIIHSLDGSDIELFPYIPYLLQDLWEIGSSPQLISRLLKKNHCLNINSRVLDLGCGKGAVSINIAKEFECQVHGIDAMPEFIEESNYWADKLHQGHLCTFEVDDIRKKINELDKFDIIILGSIGPVFGNVESTLNSIKHVLMNNGYVILDDGYIPDNSAFKNENYQKKSEVEKQISNSGFEIVDSIILDNTFISDSDAEIYEKIESRAKELIIKHPDKKNIFEAYLENQRIENEILENQVVCVTWLLQKSD